MKKLVLASQSPRRIEILKNAGYQFVSRPVSLSEIPNENLSLDEQILDIAKQKAEACLQANPDFNLDSVILSCDTMVCFNDKALGKPSTESEAFDTLKLLSGRLHQVKTALIMIEVSTGKRISHIETSTVEFNELSESQILNYIKTKDPFDKAGSYGIQNIGSVFVKNISGDYQNIVGLPLLTLEKLFEENNFKFEKIDYYNQILSKLKTDQKILAVSKLQSIDKIYALYEKGQIHFAENYIQESLEKIEKIKLDTKASHIKWHFIGRLQKNKVKFLKNHFDYIHSVDSLELAQMIDQKAAEINYIQKIFIQLNISEESSKSGLSEAQFENDWPKLKQLNNVEIVGLMTMPPLQNEAEDNRFFYKKLKSLGDAKNLKEFSMGTSHDYTVALDEGATWIRLGTILFGQRT